jgi:hypothetical protein
MCPSYYLENKEAKDKLKSLQSKVKLTKRHDDFKLFLNGLETDPDVHDTIVNEINFCMLYMEQLKYVEKYKSDNKMKSYEIINNCLTSYINDELHEATTSNLEIGINLPDIVSPPPSSSNISPSSSSLGSYFRF